MPAENNTANLKDYKDLIETIAKVEFQKFSLLGIIELSELVNIGNHTLYLLFKNSSTEKFNSTYLATAIKWAIRNEVRRRYKWYTLKNSRKNAIEEDIEGENNVREEVYRTILSIEEMQEAEIPTQIKALDNTPDENIELIELKNEILQSIRKLLPRERELIEAKFFQNKKLKDIADEFDLSQSRISRIIQGGLDKIKHDLKKQGII